MAPHKGPEWFPNSQVRGEGSSRLTGRSQVLLAPLRSANHRNGVGHPVVEVLFELDVRKALLLIMIGNTTIRARASPPFSPVTAFFASYGFAAPIKRLRNLFGTSVLRKADSGNP